MTIKLVNILIEIRKWKLNVFWHDIVLWNEKSIIWRPQYTLIELGFSDSARTFWAYTQRVIFWVLEHTLKGSFFGSLSVRSKGHFWGLWAYAQRAILGVIERTLKGSFLGLWAYAQLVFFGSFMILMKFFLCSEI